jgi:hypothetical protein
MDEFLKTPNVIYEPQFNSLLSSEPIITSMS